MNIFIEINVELYFRKLKSEKSRKNRKNPQNSRLRHTAGVRTLCVNMVTTVTVLRFLEHLLLSNQTFYMQNPTDTLLK